MFEPNKLFYMTRAIAEELPVEHQQFIVQYILKHHQQLTDYLQIFEFYIEDDQQWFIQRQEEPERETTIFVELTTARPIERKVWIMDQVDHVMMLFPEDY
ncbi:DUF960 family protein [Ureibacillus endophyticus]|uniref:DUF960 domain-containing protein n=1 Tax=Ureibacillus endophyticus TaxID=1978490 RepID=A0A494YRR7_9BACL|nr:DUF960 family protein [Lysinibacillus endophyticus]RKQ12140.1 hypothetical protein D8M03_17185 [Lysinibacillus endophyticus]